MEGWQIAIILKPIGAILIMAVIVFFAVRIEWFLRWILPEGKFKRFLLFRWKV